MLDSMSPENPNRPRIGIPWRTSLEEAEGNLSKISRYKNAVREAGGEAILLALSDPAGLQRQLPLLEGFVLPGSPADVDPNEYGTVNYGKSEAPDPSRERTDRAILDHAFSEKKPVLAICYGCQLLNVYLGGTLIQDLHSETPSQTPHRRKDLNPEPKDDPRHEVRFEPGSRLALMAGGTRAEVNSSHHQAVGKAGRQLQVTGYATDGTVESVEWTGDANWVIGVQWHPERMAADALAKHLFTELVVAAWASRRVRAAKH
jgi:putative glutamine amidotransferase